MRRSLWVWVVMAAGLGSRAWAAAGQPEPVAIVWDAPAACPPAAAVLGNVDRILTEPASRRAPAGAAAHAQVMPGDPWQATLILDIGGVRTERRFEAESCEAIAEATSLIIALAIEDEAETPPSPFPSPQVVALPAGEKLPERAPGSAHSGLAPSRGFLTANGVIDWGTLPGAPAGGIEAAAGWRWGSDRTRLRALAAASYFPTRELAHTAYAGYIYGDFWLVSFSARGCAAVALSRFEIGPCLGGELAAMHASGSDNNPFAVASKTGAWFSGLASAVASWHVSTRTLIAARADVTVPTTRSTFVTTYGDQAVYQIPAIAFRGALGVEYSF